MLLTTFKKLVFTNLVLLKKLNKILTTALPQESVVSSIVIQIFLLFNSFLSFASSSWYNRGRYLLRNWPGPGIIPPIKQIYNLY